MIFIVRETGRKRELCLLTLIYCLSQGMLLLVTGRWWDDWVLWNEPDWALRYFASQMGRPSFYYIISFTKILPEVGCRFITFFSFYFCMLFLYKILRKWFDIESNACFWICAIYAIIPVNDIRILRGSIPYSLGLCLFMAGFSHLSELLYDNRMNRKSRICNLATFFLAFILNSNLCFYALILLMIFTYEKNFKRLIRYVDYFLIPIVFFLIKTSFFPVWGRYAGYNTITVEKVLKALTFIFPAGLKMLKSLFLNWFGIDYKLLFLIVLIVTIVNFIVFRKNENNVHERFFLNLRNKEQIKKIFLMLFVGGVGLLAGLFPYVAVRQSSRIFTTGNDGRDAILVAFGGAIIIYSLVTLVLGEKFAGLIFSVLIVLGGIHFNTYYLAYQEDYYRQLGFQYQLKEHEELAELVNIIYLNSDPGIINNQVFYHLNGNGEVAYGNQIRCFISGFSGARDFLQQEGLDFYVESDNYHMSEYDTSYKRIDAVVDYSFSVCTVDVIRMKLYEMFNQKKFDQWLANNSRMMVMIDGTEEYDEALLKAGYENIE